MPKPIDDRLASYAYIKEITILTSCESNNQIVNVKIEYEIKDENKNLLGIKKKIISLYNSSEFKNIIELLDIFNIVVVPQIISDKLDYVGDFDVNEYLINDNIDQEGLE